MDSQEFKTVTDDGVWKRTVHPLNPHLPLILAKCGGGWLNAFKKVIHDGVWNWTVFKGFWFVKCAYTTDYYKKYHT